ncbi:isopenicillin N synthase family dioxygenase [Shimia ponticola]|uniref:isopenicillin N synthase family dioxygenase n=1 Tax=Shimia ponticola TaxID=2582893 RepID=UPI0011BEE400|nr:2OG-Fe(II) oxygenase family protein [Shimia ponticola]
MVIETVDLAAFEAAEGGQRAAIAADVDRICRESGFLVLSGHGVPQPVIQGVWDACRAFFDQPMEVKRTLTPVVGDPYGYLGPKAEALAASKGVETPPDLKESFNGGPLSVPGGASAEAMAFCYAPTPFPEMAGFREAWVAYYTAMEDLAERVMRLFAAALELDEGFFAPYIDAPISALRALNYPATEDAPEAGQQRAGAHTDYGSLTILLTQPGSRGLQIARGEDWVDVPTPEGAFVINIGDLMERWTANRWVSTLHRVAAVPGQPRRQSLAFFHQPNWEAEIRPLDGSDRYPSVKSGPYLMGKFQATSA